MTHYVATIKLLVGRIPWGGGFERIGGRKKKLPESFSSARMLCTLENYPALGAGGRR